MITIIAEKPDIMQVCEPRHRQHIPPEIREKTAHERRKLCFDFLALAHDLLFFQDNVIRLVALIMNFYLLFLSHSNISSNADSVLS